MRTAHAILGLLYRFERAVLLAAFAIMAVAIVVDVGFREIRGVGFAGAPRISVFAMIVVAFIGMAMASATGEHLRPQFADRLLPRAWEPALIRIGEALFALFCLIAAALAGVVVAESFALEERTRTLKLLVWPLQLVLPLAFLLTGVHHILYAAYPALRPEALRAKAERQAQDAARQPGPDGPAND